MQTSQRKPKRANPEYERRKQEVGLLLDARSRQANRKRILHFGGKKKSILTRRRRILTLVVLVITIGMLGVLHEFFF